MLDLASRGLIVFRETAVGSSALGDAQVGIDVQPAAGTQTESGGPRQRNARRPIGPAEEVALNRLQTLGGSTEDAFITPAELPTFGSDVGAFDSALEAHVVGAAGSPRRRARS